MASFAFWCWYAKLLADSLAEHVIDIVVHRDDGLRSAGCVAELCVTSLLPTRGEATVLVEILDELAFLHALTRTLR